MVREECGSAPRGMQPCDRKKFLQAVHQKFTQKIKSKKDFAQDTIHRYGDRPFALAIPRKE